MRNTGQSTGRKIILILALASMLSFSFPLSAVRAQEASRAENPSDGAASELMANGPQSGEKIFTSTQSISIPASGAATPYPSSVAVSGMAGKIVDVNVQLNGITHTHPDDLDIMLVSPTGQSIVLMSDAGGTAELSNAYVAFDDSAPAMLPDSSLINGNQAYKPTNYEPGEVLPPPAPALSGASPLSIFDGTYPNGTWHLFVFDDATQDVGTISSGWSLSIAVSAPGAAGVMDFDGDGKTDYAVARNAGDGTLNWYMLQSTGGFKAYNFGLSSDFEVPGDYDGDGIWDIAVYRWGPQATFYILRSSNGLIDALPFGTTGDEPRNSQDFDGDGKCDLAVIRNVGGTFVWYIQRSQLGFTSVYFGAAQTDVGIRGDFDGDGKADVAVYRNSSASSAPNTFFILRSQSGTMQAAQFGVGSTDEIVPGDFDGDNKTDIAVWRSTNGAWYWLQSSDGAFRALQFGTNNDRPTPGDYDRDGKTDQVVWRSSAPSSFYINHSVLGQFEAIQFGALGDVVPGYMLQVR